jgi:starch synthase
MPVPLRICFVTSEVAPLAKTGGLADVAGALPRYLHSKDHDVRVVMPLYSRIDTRALDMHAVQFLQNVPLALGPHHFQFSVFTAALPGSSLMIYFVHCPALYDRPGIYTGGADEHLRFLLLTRAAIESCQHMGFAPQIFHCNDWHTAFGPLFLRSIYAWDRLFAATRTVLTIHNVGYQGIFAASATSDLALGVSNHLLHQDDLRQGRINALKHGILYADAVTTVSPTYAREITTATYGMGLEDTLRMRPGGVTGILNGIDYSEWNPQTDRFIPHHFDATDLSGKEKTKQHLLKMLKLRYDPRRRTPLLGIVSRLTAQKGFDLLFEPLPRILRERPLRVVALGSGEARYEEFFARLQYTFPAQVVYHRGYHEELAHFIEAASDMFAMPSLYEPCGLNQMYSLKYGTVPIVRRTGGLADAVQLYDPDTGKGTGIVFSDYNAEAAGWAINAALELYADRAAWNRIQRNGMAQDFSWEKQGALYVELYERMLRS